MSQEPTPEIVPPRPPTPPLPENVFHGTSSAGTGVLGESNTGPGVSGRSVAYGGGNPPMASVGGNSDGVLGESQGTGVHGISSHNGDGVLGESQFQSGVHGIGKSSAENASGVWGENTAGGKAVSGTSDTGWGTGVYGRGAANGVWGETKSANDSGVWGNNTGGGKGVSGTSDAANGIGVYGRGAHLAGSFEGDVQVTGDIFLKNQDCAEDFEVLDAEEIGPGSVVVIHSVGVLKQSDKAYDKRVAGVISGAGDCRPGIILGRQQLQDSKMPVALVGKVYCKVDAGYSSIEVGDLLTSSVTPGHAMKAEDNVKAFGAVIGKALRGLETGQGLIPILVALQ